MSSILNTLAKGAGLFAVIVAIHAGNRYFQPPSHGANMHVIPYLFAGASIGWMGLTELRRQGRHDLVRAIQLVVLVLTIPVMLRPAAFSYLPLWAAAIVMVFACGAALWLRRYPGNAQ